MNALLTDECQHRHGSRVSWPGPRRVDRFMGPDGRMTHDRIRRDNERAGGGSPLLTPVMRYPAQISDGLRSLAGNLAALDCRGRSEADERP